jgi:hypothetical protein
MLQVSSGSPTRLLTLIGWEAGVRDHLVGRDSSVSGNDITRRPSPERQSAYRRQSCALQPGQQLCPLDIGFLGPRVDKVLHRKKKEK